jgi:hypothetical protein
MFSTIPVLPSARTVNPFILISSPIEILPLATTTSVDPCAASTVEDNLVLVNLILLPLN